VLAVLATCPVDLSDFFVATSSESAPTSFSTSLTFRMPYYGTGFKSIPKKDLPEMSGII
jgi:hypothetical protein